VELEQILASYQFGQKSFHRRTMNDIFTTNYS
jgi:hypothetical protein